MHMYELMTVEGEENYVKAYGSPYQVDYWCTCTLFHRQNLACMHLFFVMVKRNLQLREGWVLNHGRISTEGLEIPCYLLMERFRREDIVHAVLNLMSAGMKEFG